MSADFNPVPVIIAGLMGAAVVVGVIYIVAARWKRRSGAAYCFSALLIYALMYPATFQYGIVNLDTRGKGIAADSVWLIVLGQSAITAFGVMLFTLMLFGCFLALRSRPDRPVNQVKSFAGCTVFCLAVAAFFSPMDAAQERVKKPPIAAAALAATQSKTAVRQVTTERLDRLVKRGVIDRIEDGKYAVTHYVGARFGAFSDDAIKRYAKAALDSHLYFNSGRSKPVVLRESGSGRRIAVRYPDGRFKRY